MSKKKKSKSASGSSPRYNPNQKKESIGALLKDLITNPFEYRKKTGDLGKILGGVCLFAALCLLFYITGHM